jgi:protease-4
MYVPTLMMLSVAAQAEPVERPTLPFRSLAGEDGVHTLYVNPSLMNFDRDAGYAAYFDTTGTGGVQNFTLATTGGGVGAGFGYRQIGPDGDGWWTLSSGVSLRMTDSLALGSSVNWQLPDGGDNNFVSWDLGATWRPAPFFGLAGSVQNLGSPAPDLGVVTRYGGGVAVRPAGDLVTVGADWRFSAPPDAAGAHSLEASVRLRPVPGLWIRLFGEQGLTDTTARTAGLALEINAADVGFGAHGRASSAGFGGGGYVQSVASDDQLFRGSKDVAVFELDGSYPYQPVGSLLSAPEEGYLTLLRRVRDAARDPHVRGLLLRLDNLPFSFAQIEELRALVLEARANGKPVAAYLSGDTSNGAYLLASACDRVLLHPAGNLDVVGVSAEMQYFRGTLALAGVGAQYAKRGQYKSAPEQWTSDQSSDPARQQMEALLDDLYGTMVDGVAKGRGKTVEDVRALVDQGPFTGDEALQKGLVDTLVYPDELEDALTGLFPADWNADEFYAASPDTSGWEPQRAIAVVVVDGVIASGPSSPGGLLGGAATGSETVVQALDQARNADAVKAVVLRVDSPGGSAFASDEIWRAVERVEEAGKPVVVSMGSYAASGGYYVSAGASRIFALPSTVTGSIGIYGGKFNVQGLFDKLDVGVETFSRGRNAGMYTMSRPFDDVEFAALDRMIADGYRQFKGKVEQGRKLTPERVEELAQGRVWSGADAKDQGLVDEHGGFFDALAYAEQAAGLDADTPYALVVFDPWVGEGEELPARLVRTARTGLVGAPDVLPPELQDFWSLAALRDEHVFALLPYRIEVE